MYFILSVDSFSFVLQGRLQGRIKDIDGVGEGDGGQFCIACSVTQMKILGVLNDLSSQYLGPEMSAGP